MYDSCASAHFSSSIVLLRSGPLYPEPESAPVSVPVSAVCEAEALAELSLPVPPPLSVVSPPSFRARSSPPTATRETTIEPTITGVLLFRPPPEEDGDGGAGEYATGGVCCDAYAPGAWYAACCG